MTVSTSNRRSGRLTRWAGAAVAASLIAAVIIAPTAVGDDTVDAETSTAEPIQVSVPVYTTPGPNNTGQLGIVNIRVGRSAPMRVILDTGSIGLRLFPGALDRYRTGARVTQQTVTSPDQTGNLTGVIASAPISIGGLTTTRDIRFQVTKNTSSWVQQWVSRGVYGILGVGTGAGPLPNPLLALPGGTGDRWSIHYGGEPAARVPGRGSFILGANAPTNALATFQMPPAGPNGYGSMLWDDHNTQACWGIGQRRPTCIDTWFDSVADRLTLIGPYFAGVPRTADGFAKSGVEVSLSDPGSAFEASRFRTGQTPSVNLTKVTPKGPLQVNTGNWLYYEFTVSYDTVTGTISLSRPRG